MWVWMRVRVRVREGVREWEWVWMRVWVWEWVSGYGAGAECGWEQRIVNSPTRKQSKQHHKLCEGGEGGTNCN